MPRRATKQQGMVALSLNYFQQPLSVLELLQALEVKTPRLSEESLDSRETAQHVL